MTKRSAMILLFWLAAAYGATAQTTGSLTGRIVSDKGRPITGATVRVLGTVPSRGAFSKADGSFLVAGIRIGEYDVKVDALGYQSMTVPKVRISADQTTTLRFRLTEKAADTATVAIPERPRSYQRVVIPRYDGPGRGFVIRGGRDQPRLRIDFNGINSLIELLGAADGAVEQERMENFPPVARRVADAPTRRYRPAIAASRGISLLDNYPLPYGRQWFTTDPGDPFSGGFACHPFTAELVSKAAVDPSIAGTGTYGVARRDVVEPSMAKRAEWIARYEEHRDMMSPYERALASWTRRR